MNFEIINDKYLKITGYRETAHYIKLCSICEVLIGEDFIYLSPAEITFNPTNGMRNTMFSFNKGLNVSDKKEFTDNFEKYYQQFKTVLVNWMEKK